MNILGLDPSLNNFGIAKGILTDTLSITYTDVIQHKIKKDKTKQNSRDINAALHIFKHLYPLLKDIDVIIVEVPIGSQSSRAMVSYGVCIALIGVISYFNPKVIQVSPFDVKKLVGSRTASKEDVIQWVQSNHPTLNLPKAIGKAEHIADAIAAIHVGLESKQFKEYYENRSI